MNINDAKVVLKALAEKRFPVTACLWGKHGIAKSAAVGQVAKDLGYDFFPLILSQCEAVDLLGLPYIHKDEETGFTVTDYHPPKWFAKAVKKGKMVLFLDELNRARPEVVKAAFTLVNERRLNGITIADDVIIVVACNPNDERNDVIEFDEALTDRFMHLHIKADLNVWKQWAQSEKSEGVPNIHPDITDFLTSAQEHAFHKENRDNDFPVVIRHSLRSWERASYVHQLGLRADLELECLQGVVGPDVALAFMQSLNSADKPLTANEILEMSKKTETKIQRWANPDQMTESRLDVLKESVSNLTRYIDKNNEKALKKKDSVLKFIKMLPDDLLIVAIKAIHENHDWAHYIVEDAVLFAKLNEISKTLNDAQSGSTPAASGGKSAKK